MKNNNIWIWGYVLKEAAPAEMEFIYHPTQCSMETAAKFIGADNIIFMDSTSNRMRLTDELFQHVASFKQVVCGLQHGFEAETAEMVSRFSLSHPNITGAIIDDFLDEVGPSQNMTPEDLKVIYDALKSANPTLKLYTVRYSRQNFDEIIPYLPYLDGISFWCWVSTEHYWHYQFHQDLITMRKKYNKEVLQGLFVHDYGDSDGPMDMKLLELQTPRIAKELKNHWINGIVLLQNGWFDAEDHRRQVTYLRDYFTWFNGTRTIR